MSKNLRCPDCGADGNRLEVTVRHGNYSRFYGGRLTESDWSELYCWVCGRFWRSKAQSICWLSDVGDKKPFGVEAERKGWLAGLNNQHIRTCPYKDIRTESGRITYSRAFRKRWIEGWQRGLKKAMKGGRR